MAERRGWHGGYRRCPKCGAVRLGNEFRRAGKPDFGPDRPTRCPVCGHVGPLLAFPKAEPPGEAEGDGGPHRPAPGADR